MKFTLSAEEQAYLPKLKEYLSANARIPPYEHQYIGVLKMIQHPYFMLADEMGAGKTKQTLDAAQVLFHQNVIDRVIVICPSAVISVWYDPELGEVAKHVWDSTPVQVARYRHKITKWRNFEAKRMLKFVVTNYDFIRKAERLNRLGSVVGERTLLVLDESSYVKNEKAQQTKACAALRKYCGRVILLNGTPLTESLGDLYSQMAIMHRDILGCKSFYHFRARYAELGGWQGKQIIRWHGIEEVQRKISPYVIRRLKTDCLDLPKKLPSVYLTVPLSKESWARYKQMESEFVAWLGTAEASMASHAAVRAMRLQQITSGFVGGVKRLKVNDEGELIEIASDEIEPLTIIGTEKQDMLLSWMKEKIEEDPLFKIVIWSRFTVEIENILQTLSKIPNLQLGSIRGGQKEADRDHAKRLLDPRTAPQAPVAVVGNSASGGMGLSLTAADHVMYVSNYWRLITRLQSEDRVHRPGQVNPVNYFDVVATGPNGQKTIDHLIISRLKGKQDLATMTTAAWVQSMKELRNE